MKVIERYDTNDQPQPKKRNQSLKWILFGFLLVIYSIVFFIVINLQSVPVIQVWLEILIYLFIMVLLFGPFIPMKRKGGKRISIVGSLVHLIQGPIRHRFQPKPDSNLNVQFRAPLIHKCKCGFLITRKMERCPNCMRNNEYYSKD
jgi:hypothetical protein